MGVRLDPINVINAALCITITILGYLGYREKRELLPLFIGIAFALFGLSHMVTLLGFAGSSVNFLVTIRVIAYLIIVGALCRISFLRR